MIRFSNLDDERMTLLSLVKAGYGSLAELEALDTSDFLDLVEFESISRDIEAYYVERAHKRRGKWL